MVRSKNVLSVLMQVFVCFCLIAVLWVIYGYSVAFSGGNAFFGGFSKMFLAGVNADSLAATFSKGVAIPELAFVAFQLTFAAITPALIVGAFAERVKFSAVLVFLVLWFTFAYLPIAHMVWYWDGPDANHRRKDARNRHGRRRLAVGQRRARFRGRYGRAPQRRVAGLVGAYVIGKRVGYGKESMAPHNLPITMIGACLLWVGWFGFNAGSNLEANGTTALAFLNTLVATASATLAWSLIESFGKGKASMLGAVSGAVAGLVAITPACGFVGTMGALVIGVIAGLVCYWGVNGLKRLLGADDSLDVFGVHGVGGATGALLTGVFAAPVARRRRNLRLCRQQSRRQLLDLGPGCDSGNGLPDDHHLVRRGRVHRLQAGRSHNRPARHRGRRARRPGRFFPRRGRVPHVTTRVRGRPGPRTPGFPGSSS